MGILGAYETPLVLGIVVLGPALLPKILAAFKARSNISKSPNQALPNTLKAVLAAHTLLLLYTVIYPPSNIFLASSLPITSPLVASIYPPEITQRLSSLAQRLLYARFGHEAVVNCTWCTAWEDFALVAMPGVGKWYIAEAVYVGLLGYWRNGARGACAMVLCALAIAEVGVMLFWDVNVVEGDAIHLFTNIHILRNVALLYIPLIYIYLPSLTPASFSTSVPSPAQLQTLQQSLSSTLQTLRLTSISQSALSRNPALRPQRRVERSVWADDGVRKAIGEAGVDLERVKREAGSWVQDGWEGVRLG